MSRTKHRFKGNPPMLRGSSRHVALGVLKISNTLLPAELFEFNPQKFLSVRHSEKILEEIAGKGWAERTESGFVMTAKGRAILIEMGARSPYSG